MDSMGVMPKSVLEAPTLAAYSGTKPNRQAHTQSQLAGRFQSKLALENKQVYRR